MTRSLAITAATLIVIAAIIIALAGTSSPSPMPGTSGYTTGPSEAKGAQQMRQFNGAPVGPPSSVPASQH